MAIVGAFHIVGSSSITGRGLIIVGDLTAGKVKAGDFITLNANGEAVTLKIGGVGMGRTSHRETDYIGLTIAYKDDEERSRFSSLKLTEQHANISDQMKAE